MGGEAKNQEVKHAEENPEAAEKHAYRCDRCGFNMYEKNCKVVCPNCGNRFDCSDLNIYFDELLEGDS